MADSKAAAAAPGKDAAPAAKGKDAPGAAAKDDGKAAGKKKNPKQMIILGAAALLLVAAAGATWFFFFRSHGDAPPAETAAADSADKKDKDGKDKKDKKGETKRPYFVEFESFTVNLKDPDKFLQIKITLQVHEADAAETLKDMMPLVRSAIIPVLSAQDAAELATPEGKEKLSGQVVAAAKKAVATVGAEDSIDAALITHMIIQ